MWTTRRKALGNLVPALVWLPPTVAGLWITASTSQLIGAGLWFLAGSSVLGWLALDAFGLFENGQMRSSLKTILTERGEPPAEGSAFVGLTTPKYHGLLDAHEDVGFLQILPDKLVFVSETRQIEFLLSEVRHVRFRLNIHSFVLLGRWVSVEGVSAGKPIRMLLEPRERPTMLGNLRESFSLQSRLAEWAKQRKVVP